MQNIQNIGHIGYLIIFLGISDIAEAPSLGKVFGARDVHPQLIIGKKSLPPLMAPFSGRVLAVTGQADDFKEALRRAYEAVAKISFDPPGASGIVAALFVGWLF